jgi:cyclophilin family peptidyl-prolyl cis-trans isomerase
MANKKKIQEIESARRKKQTERTIQIAAGVIVALIAIGVIWLALPGRSSNVLELPTDAAASANPTEASTTSQSPNSTAKQYDAYPPMTIDKNKKYLATFKMAKGGDFVVQLFPDKAPKTVNNFVFLARDGYYDNTTFHRVLEGFMAQGGDPTGTGSGGPGYYFEYEASDLKFDKPGVMAMANQGPATPTNGSQFFITFVPTPQLDGGYTIFGQVIQGMDVVNGITRRDPDTNPTFQGDVIQTITITEE